MNRKDAVEVERDSKYGNDLDGVVKQLEDNKAEGKSVFIDFNGHKLYSCDVTLDSAYMQVTGMTMEESKAIREALAKAKTDEEEKAIIEKGKSIVKKHQEEAKKSATQTLYQGYGTLDNVVKYLQECNKDGQNVYVDFNGIKLYSCDVTLDSAYMQVGEMTKAEDEVIRGEYRQAETDEERDEIIAKWNSVGKARQEAGDKKENITVLDSAIEATEGKTRTSTINKLIQRIKDRFKGKDEKVEETGRDEE